MGDRAMAQIKQGSKSLYFYTHWTGFELPEDARKALKRAEPRRGDDSYVLRIIVDDLIAASGARDCETGAGLMFGPNAQDEYNHDKPSVVIDLDKWTVTERRGGARAS